jgi:TetR/AcrR family transcriptional regulator
MSKPLLFCPLVVTVRAKHERRKEARPAELLAAALDLFVEKGFAATRAEEVAKRAGVSKGTLFLYFSSKEELFKAVVRKNLSTRYAEWGKELDTYEGSSADMLRYCVATWWEHVGSTKVSGISKLMMSEAGNFPELAAFYQKEVIEPGSLLLKHILQRGMDSGEFRPIDLQYGIYAILAPLLYLAHWRHSFGACCEPNAQINPQDYLSVQIDNILLGLNMRPVAAIVPQLTPNNPKS